MIKKSILKKNFYIKNKFSFGNTTNQNYYEILSIDKNANLGQIKLSYYKKVKEFHPDHNKDPSALEHFKVLVKAYEVLKDPTKREIYNLSLKNVHFRESDAFFYEDYYQNTDSNKQYKEYYSNKWYGFKKPDENLHDEYFERKNRNNQEEIVIKSILLRFGLICGIIIAFDLIRYGKNYKKNKKYEIQKELFEDGYKETNLKIISKNKIYSVSDYIEKRKEKID